MALTRAKRAIQLPEHILGWLAAERPGWSRCIEDACRTNEQRLPDAKYISVKQVDEIEEPVPADVQRSSAEVIPIKAAADPESSKHESAGANPAAVSLGDLRVLGDVPSFKCCAKRMKELAACFPDDKNFAYMLKIASALADGEAVLVAVPAAVERTGN